MDREPELSDELTAFTDALQGLQPVAGRIDRDQILYDAGRASAGRVARPNRAVGSPSSAHWMWPLVTVVSVVVAVASLSWHIADPAPHIPGREPTHVAESGEATKSAPAPRVPSPHMIRSAPTYLLEREQALAGRFEDRRRPTSSGDRPIRGPVSHQRLIEELLQETLL